jgi:hypothetical protein
LVSIIINTIFATIQMKNLVKHGCDNHRSHRL